MKVEGIEKLLSIDARGNVGRSGGYGGLRFGYNFFAFHYKYFGVYQLKHRPNARTLSRMKYYRPYNPQTIKQQNWRAVLANALVFWNEKDPEQKQIFNRRSKDYKGSGYNLYLKEFLKNKPHAFGAIYFGYGF